MTTSHLKAYYDIVPSRGDTMDGPPSNSAAFSGRAQAIARRLLIDRYSGLYRRLYQEVLAELRDEYGSPTPDRS